VQQPLSSFGFPLQITTITIIFSIFVCVWVSLSVIASFGNFDPLILLYCFYGWLILPPTISVGIRKFIFDASLIFYAMLWMLWELRPCLLSSPDYWLRDGMTTLCWDNL
jgi:hypothetical protein